MRDPRSCRSCQQTLPAPFLDLGLQPLANNLLGPADRVEDEPRFPLQVAVCPACHLVQLTVLVPPVELFSDYLYFSSFSDAMVAHARAAVDAHVAADHLGPDSFVIEIASNDGYLLKRCVELGIPCLGVEPAENIAAVAREAGVPTECAFFGTATAAELVARHRRADLILGNNVFAHAPDINDFLAGLQTALAPGGRIVLEFPYLGDFLDKLEFDTVYHEHVFYFSLLALEPAFARHGLEIFAVERLPIHGGSLRLHAGHRGEHPLDPSVAGLRQDELARGLDSPAVYRHLAEEVQQLREKLRTLLTGLKAEGKSIAAYGASAKGSTLLNFFGIGAEALDFIVDRSTHKQGRRSPGTHLEILPVEALLERQPDYALLLTWNFQDEILSQQAEYQRRGGRFIVPLPEPAIL